MHTVAAIAFIVVVSTLRAAGRGMQHVPRIKNLVSERERE